MLTVLGSVSNRQNINVSKAAGAGSFFILTFCFGISAPVRVRAAAVVVSFDLVLCLTGVKYKCFKGTWCSVLNDTERTDVVRLGRPSPVPCTAPIYCPRHFVFRAFEITNNVSVTLFSLDSFPPSVSKHVVG